MLYFAETSRTVLFGGSIMIVLIIMTVHEEMIKRWCRKSRTLPILILSLLVVAVHAQSFDRALCNAIDKPLCIVPEPAVNLTVVSYKKWFLVHFLSAIKNDPTSMIFWPCKGWKLIGDVWVSCISSPSPMAAVSYTKIIFYCCVSYSEIF